MSEAPTILYLESDDEVTSVVRRIRAADPGHVMVVAPGRSRATSSVVALRLLARAADADSRPLTIVGDALTRSLAAEAGVPAFGTLDEARRSDGSAPPPPDPHRAAIHVIRGPATDDTAPTLAAASVAAAAVGAPKEVAPIPGDADITRSVPVVRPAPAPAARAATARRRALPAALLGAVALLLAGAIVAAAALLPAATITIAPHAETVGPRPYSVVVDDVSRHEGTATATAEVVASGTYRVQEPASGSVSLFNWTFFPVEVPAGTFVAAGEQAFATQAAVVVPRGRLTGAGTIAAGDVEVAVVAAAPGPAANVAAEAISVVVNEDVDARLRGFPENPQPRVLNPAPTEGGTDTSGPEIIQADVDAAVEALRGELAQSVEAAVADVPQGVTVVGEPVEATIEGVEGLVGTRDQETAEIQGSQTWTVDVADPDQVTAAAESAFLDDPAAVPDGMEILAGSTTVTVGEATIDGESMRVDTTVSARAAPVIDPEAVRETVAGATVEEAEAALADIGQASVELWPGWVTTVPTMDARVEVLIVDAEAQAP